MKKPNIEVLVTRLSPPQVLIPFIGVMIAAVWGWQSFTTYHPTPVVISKDTQQPEIQGVISEQAVAIENGK